MFEFYFKLELIKKYAQKIKIIMQKTSEFHLFFIFFAFFARFERDTSVRFALSV